MLFSAAPQTLKALISPYMPETRTTFSRQSRFKFREPSQYHVVLRNDDVTTMEFVVMVLMTIFHKSRPEAFALMMKIHREGSGIAGTYYMDIAKTKAQKTTTLARQNGFPLEVTIQEVI